MLASKYIVNHIIFELQPKISFLCTNLVLKFAFLQNCMLDNTVPPLCDIAMSEIDCALV